MPSKIEGKKKNQIQTKQFRWETLRYGTTNNKYSFGRYECEGF